MLGAGTRVHTHTYTQVLAGPWADQGPISRPLPQPSAHSHGTGRVAGVTTLHILHLAGVHVWDRHLLELLHLAGEEGHTEGQGWASSSASVPKGLVAVQAHKDTWLPGWKAAFLGFLNTSWTGPGVRGAGTALSTGTGNRVRVCQECQDSVLRLGTARVGPEGTPGSYCGHESWTPGGQPSTGTWLSLKLKSKPKPENYIQTVPQGWRLETKYRMLGAESEIRGGARVCGTEPGITDRASGAGPEFPTPSPTLYGSEAWDQEPAWGGVGVRGGSPDWPRRGWGGLTGSPGPGAGRGRRIPPPPARCPPAQKSATYFEGRGGRAEH